MNNLLKKIILMFLLGLPVVARAQQNLSLSLEQAKEHAVTYNRTLLKAGISIEEAQESLWQAISAGLPQVEAKVDYSNYLGFSMSFGGQSIAFNPTSNAQLTASQLIFSGQYWVGIEMAKLAKNLAEKNVAKTELEVKQSVSLSYYAILLAEQNKDILKKNIENMRDIHKRTKDIANVGLLELTDAEQLEVQVMNLDATLISLDRQIELAYNMLRLQLGVEHDTQITLTSNINDLTNKISLQTLLSQEFSLDNNIDFQLLKSQEELQKKQITLNKTAYLPTIAGFYSYTYKIKKPAFDMSPANMVGLQATIPIFSSFQRKSKVKQSQIQLKALQTDIKQVEDQLLIQEKQLRFNLQTASDQYALQQKNVDVARRVFESSKRKHEQGLLSSLDLTTANTNYLQAESGLLTAKNELLKAQTELLKLLGIL
ncbi:MAG: TolC family protein [Prevotellaceae bacterium]|nr:TolC family protein [Prevotellaceae bacterium]